MPVLESTGKLAPKSLLRHRPIGEGAAPAVTQVPLRASRLPSADADEVVVAWKRLPEQTGVASAWAGTTGTAVPSSKKFSHPSQPEAAKRGRITRLQAHPRFIAGLGMLVMLLLWLLVSAFLSWATTTLDTLRYGYPRTFQTDAWVGHNEQSGTPSHFIAINLHRHIQIIELAGSDPAHTRIYSGPQLSGPNDDLIPITLSFADVNGDHQPDMLVHVQNAHLIFINDQGKFRPPLPSERPQVEQFLQRLPAIGLAGASCLTFL